MTAPSTAGRRSIGVVHPGAMGAAVGGLLAGAGHRIVWAGDQRSRATHRRAEAAGLVDLGSLDAVAGDADVVVSLCPPAAAVDVASRLARAEFAGAYVDANAIAPTTMRRIADRFDTVVDGSVVGGPPVPGDDHPTRLYLAGPRARDVADLFDDDALEVVVLDAPVGAASGVKAAFAGWTKATAALAMALRAMARAEDVEDVVLAEWRRSLPGLVERSGRAGVVAAKAWRFEGELREIAAAMAAQGLPPGFHTGAADVYAALADLRHDPDPDVDDVLDRLVPRSSAATRPVQATAERATTHRASPTPPGPTRPGPAQPEAATD